MRRTLTILWIGSALYGALAALYAASEFYAYLRLGSYGSNDDVSGIYEGASWQTTLWVALSAAVAFSVSWACHALLERGAMTKAERHAKKQERIEQRGQEALAKMRQIAAGKRAAQDP